MREYPVAPLVGVGALIVEHERVLLVRRERPPALGKWSIPGGLVHVGESVEAAVRREVVEECGLDVEVRGLVGIVDRIVRDAEGRVQYHYVLLDYLATPRAGRARAGSDAQAVRWATLDDLKGLDTTEGLEAMMRRALAMAAEPLREEGAICS
jgi:ADP-ribose pyrophosphatase YjhB (NUDIX family)